MLVSFDFDETLCLNSFEGFIVNPKILKFIESNRGRDIEYVVVTSRYKNKNNEQILWNFVRKFNLPIMQIFFCNGNLKYEALQGLRVDIHFDDDPDEIDAATKNGIDARFVDEL